ncbi:MAG: DUF4252 domain-containing protein [Cyclobacteriaceae bacterium]|jgi:hypothetical protein|nr:DUF4252 domain-containing protein [Flammeovirgaceae bacterium]MCZ8021330.1 DUF4252 domain-containing protein [Cytophagales bacterium]MCZ8327910.1 DUF4252 domain-containing protein [Cyclobacteriaceae bacterium]
MTKLQCIFLFSSLLVVQTIFAQSKTTQDLHKSYPDARVIFFYKNTLRMINQTDSKEFDDLIKDIDKLKILIIDKSVNYSASNFKKLSSNYKQDGFEEIMTSRVEGRSFDVYLKEKNNKTLGTVVLVNDVDKLYVLDVVGSVPMQKIPEFFKQINNSTELQNVIKEIAGSKNEEKDKSKKEDN